MAIRVDDQGTYLTIPRRVQRRQAELWNWDGGCWDDIGYAAVLTRDHDKEPCINRAV